MVLSTEQKFFSDYLINKLIQLYQPHDEIIKVNNPCLGRDENHIFGVCLQTYVYQYDQIKYNFDWHRHIYTPDKNINQILIDIFTHIKEIKPDGKKMYIYQILCNPNIHTMYFRCAIEQDNSYNHYIINVQPKFISQSLVSKQDFIDKSCVLQPYTCSNCDMNCVIDPSKEWSQQRIVQSIGQQIAKEVDQELVEYFSNINDYMLKPRPACKDACFATKGN